jgi:AAA+ ATPase superfamily predicted ATPase
MKPNPGGIIKGEAIVDRENEIESLWNDLQTRSIVLASERRVGKTSVLRKMYEHPNHGWIPVIYWVERVREPIDFIQGLYDALTEEGILEEKSCHNLKKMYHKFVGGEVIGNWKLPQLKDNWQTMLGTTVEEIVATGKKVLIMIDELPLMLWNILEKGETGAKTCMEFLDTLRELRNKFEGDRNIAFIFCGSIGLHIVIEKLKREYGYAGNPTNNMKKASLTGMDEAGAKLLCEKLSEGNDYCYDEKVEVFSYLCQRTDSLPYYIQHVFAYLENLKEKTVTRKTIDDAIDFLHNDSKDEGEFRHYVERMKIYYHDNVKNVSLAILDNMVYTENYISEIEIIDTLQAKNSYNEDIIKETLELLRNDHYLIRESKPRRYKFKYTILQKWWKINRS